MSSLSIEKLQYFTQNNGYEIHKIFVKDSRCFLVELMSIHTIDYILLYIPDKYKFELPPELTTYSVHEVQPNISKTDDIDEYTHISESLVQSSYSHMEAIISLPTDKRSNIPMSEHLDESYKKNVILDDINGNDNITSKNIYRQLRRLKYCIKGMPYKLGIMNAPYIGILNNQDIISMYCCDMLKRKNKQQKLYIVIDFKMFYDKINTVEEECSQIFKGIYTVLNNNQKMHATNIKHIMDRRDNILNQSTFLQNCKKKYSHYIDQYTELLEELYSYEKSKDHNLNQLKSIVNQSNNLHHDMKRSHQKTKIEKEIREMKRTRGELIKTIQDVKTKNENLTLSIDTILFDNIVMLDKIFKNFDELNKLEAELK
jgi:hypothetical protein